MWNCSHCGEIEGKSVTINERCYHCGGPVQWESPVKGSALSPSERVCVDIYLAIHVSTIRKEVAPVREAWELGQDMYGNISS